MADQPSLISKFPMPIYLNQKYVFDMLAMMEGGFSQLETIKTTQSEQEDKTRRMSGDIGVTNAFSFLGISLGGERSTKAQTGGEQEVTTEKVHTPNSLFARLRERLHTHELGLVETSHFLEVTSGEFVECKVTLRKNPLIDALSSLKSFFELSLVFEDKQQPSKGKIQNQPRNAGNSALAQMQALLNQLNAEGTFDLIGTVIHDEYLQMVLTMDRSFLSDLTLSDLVDGEYTVLGKVTKVILEDSDDTINLLRKTSLGRLQGEFLDKLVNSFEGMDRVGFDLPKIVTRIEGPVIQVIPIAVFI